MQFTCEHARLETFGNWPLQEHPFPIDLIQAGFYYSGHFDQVTCAFCSGVIGNWKTTDDPLEEHHKLYPKCIYVKERMRKNEVLKRTSATGNLTNYFINLGVSDGISTRIDSFSNYRNGEATSHVTNSPQVHLNPVKHIQSKASHIHNQPQKSTIPTDYTKEKHRLKSFINWSRADQQPRELARAGLYYLGNLDRVKCFSCKTVFRDWLPGDDPWIEHSKWHPDCKYLKMCLGDEIVEDIHKEMTKHMPRDVVDAES